MKDKNTLKVLIVDDSITVRALLKAQLMSMGYTHLEEAKDGAQGCEAFQNVTPDLVFLDINMPKMNGIEALREMKQMNSDVAVVMLSSIGTKEKVQEAYELGAELFLMKPVSESDLHNVFESLL